MKSREEDAHVRPSLLFLFILTKFSPTKIQEVLLCWIP
jgi:hypothetical protein